MESALKNPLVRAAISATMLLAGYAVVEKGSEQSYARMALDVPRCRGLQYDSVFDDDLEWRRRLCAFDDFCRAQLRAPAALWSLALADAAARLVRLRSALVAPEAAGAALPPVVAAAARVAALRIFECLTAVESIALEVARRILQAPSIAETSSLLQGVAAHEINSGTVVEAMPREVVDMYKRFVALAQELKEVTDNELIGIDRLRALRAAQGAQFHADVPELLLRTLHDALALESVLHVTVEQQQQQQQQESPA